MYENGQNVHARGVQQSANDSMAALEKAYRKALVESAAIRRERDARDAKPTSESESEDEKKHHSVNAFFHKVMTKLKKTKRQQKEQKDENVVPLWESECKAAFSRGRARTLIHEICASADAAVHSVHALTLKGLLCRVWTVISVHPDRSDLVSVLEQEVIDGEGMCFTGRFTRILNVLTCYVDGIGIQISSKERIQSVMASVGTKLSALEAEGKKLGDEKVDELLRGAHQDMVKEGLSKEERREWLSPLGDMFDVRTEDIEGLFG